MSRLTEAQIAALRPQYTEYPERRLILPTYPPPRKKRGLKLSEQAALPPEEAGALPSGGLTGLPTTRIWTISVHGGTLDDTFQDSSPRYAGPGLIDFLYLQETHQAGTSFYEAFQISYSDRPGPRYALTNNAVALPGTPIYDSSFADDVGTGATDPGIPIYPALNLYNYKLDLQVYVPLKEFYVNFAFRLRIALMHRITGYFRIVENIGPPEVA